MLTVEKLPPSNRFNLKYRVNDFTFCFTGHAIERIAERGIDIESKLRSLSGLSVSQYRSKGIVCKYNRGNKTATVLTVLSDYMTRINNKNGR